MPRLSLVSSSSVAVCLRCQFRYSHRLQALRRARPPPLRPNYKSTFFTTTSLYRADNRELIVLEPPGPRQSFHRYGPSHEPQALDDSNLDSGARELLTYEFRSDNPSALDATQMEISLYKPHIVRVSRERYQQLFQELDRAFLKPQLMEYFSRSTPIKPGIKKRREVVVSKKRDILDEILRSRWGIEVTDEIAEREDVLVSKEIMSNRRDIFFMIGEDGRVLRSWAQKYSTRITVNVQTSVMQFRGSLANIERLEAAMGDMLQKIITEDVDLSWVSRLQTFNEEFITPIARITNTFIERLDDNTIRVVTLGPERHAIHDARRLIFASLDMQPRSSYSLLYSAPCEGESTKGALYPFAEDQSLSWRFRGKDWARWRDVKTKMDMFPPVESESLHAEGDRSTIITKGEGNLDGLEGIRRILDESATAQTMETEGDRVPPAEYQAILGCIIHGSDGQIISKGQESLERFVKEERPRVLSNDFPGVSFIAQAPTIRGKSPDTYKNSPKLLEDRIAYSFTLRFAPSPWSSPGSFEHYPPLEMTLEIDSASGEALNPKLVAVHSESVADLLIPSRNCDLRFLRRVDVPLALGINGQQLAVGGVTKEDMERFFEQSNLNPADDGRLRASPQIIVSIPPWMMQRAPSLPTTGIVYMFTGMEFRRELYFDWEGVRLHHTAVEGGISGGRKTEVKLVCKVNPKAKKKRLEAVRSYIEPGVEMGDLEAVDAKVHERGLHDVETQEAEAQGIGALDAKEKEAGALERVSDTAFLSFVGSAMSLVRSLDKRLADSVGRGVLR